MGGINPTFFPLFLPFGLNNTGNILFHMCWYYHKINSVFKLLFQVWRLISDGWWLFILFTSFSQAQFIFMHVVFDILWFILYHTIHYTPCTIHYFYAFAGIIMITCDIHWLLDKFMKKFYGWFIISDWSRRQSEIFFILHWFFLDNCYTLKVWIPKSW